MFDLPLPIHPTTYARVVPPHFSTGDVDPNHPCALIIVNEYTFTEAERRFG